jgi:uncharacterized protein
MLRAYLKSMCSEEGFDEDAIMKEIEPMYEGADGAHDFSHIIRVYRNAREIGKKEGANMQVLLLSALLHDVGLPSKLNEGSEDKDAGKIARDFLKKKGVPENASKKILYAIEVHRFSKGIVPNTLEAKILQDADRLDALGAIGIARVFMTGGALGRGLYNPDDPFCRYREPNDKLWNLDHFYKKLLKLESGMHTETAKKLARRRSDVLKRYLLDLQIELEEC